MQFQGEIGAEIDISYCDMLFGGKTASSYCNALIRMWECCTRDQLAHTPHS